MGGGEAMDGECDLELEVETRNEVGGKRFSSQSLLDSGRQCQWKRKYVDNQVSAPSSTGLRLQQLQFQRQIRGRASTLPFCSGFLSGLDTKQPGPRRLGLEHGAF